MFADKLTRLLAIDAELDALASEFKLSGRSEDRLLRAAEIRAEAAGTLDEVRELLYSTGKVPTSGQFIPVLIRRLVERLQQEIVNATQPQAAFWTGAAHAWQIQEGRSRELCALLGVVPDERRRN